MKNLIAFRPDKDLEKAFSDKLALLGVSESEFARRSVKLGMDRAFEELAAEQRQEAHLRADQEAFTNSHRSTFKASPVESDERKV